MTTPNVEPLSGAQLRQMFAAAARWLERNIDRVNAVNVFPVPDGDTGTNMYLTMRSTMEEAGGAGEESAGAVLAAMSHGALMGARGNSGVILSQIIRGLAEASQGSESIDSEGLARGLEEASAAAYRAVTTPVEGTILTAIRETSEAVGEAARADLDADGHALEEERPVLDVRFPRPVGARSLALPAAGVLVPDVVAKARVLTTDVAFCQWSSLYG